MKLPPALHASARERVVGVALSVVIVLVATTCIWIFDLHPAVMIFGVIFGSSLGLVVSRLLMSKRVNATGQADVR